MDRRQRLTLIAAILGSGVAMLDASIVNVALPSIERSLGGGLAAQQWIVNGYLLTLGSFILVGGSLGDVIGRGRVFALGVAGFGACSLACAAAPAIGVLIAARVLQGVASALLTPSSLAVIVDAFGVERRGAAIGSWTAWTGIAMITGPLLGGWIVGTASWRFIFLINTPIVALTLSLIRVAIPASRKASARRVDWVGASLCVLGLTGLVFALIEQPRFGWVSAVTDASLGGGLSCLIALSVWERRASDSMLKPALFAARNFSVGNLATLGMYAGLAIFSFYLVLFLQQDAGYTPFESGLATLPVTVVMFFASRRFGTLASRLGPRLFMAAGPLIAALGMLLLAFAAPPVSYLTALLPGIVLFAFGLAATVAPLTAAVLASAHERDAGIASAINNAVARIGGLLGISVVSVLIAGELPHHVFGPNPGSTHAFHLTMLACAALMASSGLTSAIGIVNPPRRRLDVRPGQPLMPRR